MNGIDDLDSLLQPCAEWANIDGNGLLDACAAQGSPQGDAAVTAAANATALFGMEYSPTAWPGTPTVVLQGKVKKHVFLSRSVVAPRTPSLSYLFSVPSTVHQYLSRSVFF